jgi:hypothetical protein
MEAISSSSKNGYNTNAHNLAPVHIVLDRAAFIARAQTLYTSYKIGAFCFKFSHRLSISACFLFIVSLSSFID